MTAPSVDRIARYAIALILTLAAIGKLASLSSSIGWMFTRFELDSWSQAAVVVIGGCVIDLVAAGILLLNAPIATRDVGAYVAALTVVGTAILVSDWAESVPCHGFGALSFLNSTVARAATLAALGMSAFVVLRNRIGLMAPLVLFLVVPGSGAAVAGPDADRAALQRRLRSTADAALTGRLTTRLLRWLPEQEQPYVARVYEAQLAYPCERWVKHARYRDLRKENDPRWKSPMASFRAGDPKELWDWVKADPRIDIAVYDGRRMLVAARSREGWWSERWLTKHDDKARSPSLFGWLSGPGQTFLWETVRDAPFVGRSRASSSSPEKWLVIVGPKDLIANALDPSKETARGPVLCIRLSFRIGATLPEELLYTKLVGQASVSGMAALVEGSRASAIETTSKYEKKEFQWNALSSVIFREAELPTHTRVVRRNGGKEDHWLSWQLTEVKPESTIFETGHRLPETENAAVYFRTDELSGRIWKAEGTGKPKPWTRESESRSDAVETSDAEASGSKLGVVVWAVALIAAGGFLWFLLRRALRHSQ